MFVSVLGDLGADVIYSCPSSSALSPHSRYLSHTLTHTRTHTHINTDCRTATCRADKQTHSRSLQVTHAPGDASLSFFCSNTHTPPASVPGHVTPRWARGTAAHSRTNAAAAAVPGHRFLIQLYPKPVAVM